MKAIGVDIGTTTICGVVLDTGSGELTNSITVDNNSWVQGDADASCQHPARILEVVRDVLARLLRHVGGSVACIGISGQMHGILYLNAAGVPVSPLFTWQDARGNRPCEGAESYARRLMALTGYSPLATGYGAVTHFCHTRIGAIPSDAATFCTIGDYIAMELTGRITPLVHPSNAAGMGLYNPAIGDFDRKAIRAAGMDAALFPPACDGFVVVGEVQGIPVGAALGDNQASFLGAVREMERSILINVGTGGQISLATHSPNTTSALIEARPCTGNGDFLLAGSSLCAGSSYALLERLFCEVVEMATGKRPVNLYAEMDRLAADGAGIEEPLSVSTRFRGTRQDPNMRGSIYGISAENLTPRHLIAGVLEGMVQEFRELYDLMELPAKRKFDRLVCSGNGARRNTPLQTVLRQRFGMPLYIPVHKEEACYGAALYALVAAGEFSTLEKAQGLIQYCAH